MHASPERTTGAAARSVVFTPLRNPADRRRRFKPLRRVYRKLRRWYRTSQTNDVVVTFVCLLGVVLLAAAGAAYLVLR